MRPPKSETPISQAARELIVFHEVTSESFYNEHWQQPTWPGGGSGVTIGIGYDLGSSREAEFEEDWGAYLDAVTLERLGAVLGKSGEHAEAVIAGLGGIRVSWGEALAQFTEQAEPRTVGETEIALPNTQGLSPSSLGALVSLVYNRGACFNAQGPHYLEMRAIKVLMEAKQYDKVPDEIRAMKRLWPMIPGLQARRDAEADLFQAGLRA